jgi:hypothetical protein
MRISVIEGFRLVLADVDRKMDAAARLIFRTTGPVIACEILSSV